jgi:putative drug exporter of the RND superfamily
LIPQDSRAIQAEIDSFRLFGFPLLSRTLVVQRDPQGLSARAQARVFLRALALNRHRYPNLDRIAGALPITNTFRLFPSSRESGTTAITYLFFLPDVGLGTRERLASEFAHERVTARVIPSSASPGRYPGEYKRAGSSRSHFRASSSPRSS